jgi:thioredoxin 1
MELTLQSVSVEKLIDSETFVLIYFSGHNCSVCQAIQPKVEHMVGEFFPEVSFVEVDTENDPELSARFFVFTVPVILFYIEGREYLRVVRNIDLSVLHQKMRTFIQMFQE